MGKTILVVGGAGYIGSHTAKLLKRQAHQVIILDDLSTGHIEATHGHLFYEGKYEDSALLQKIFSQHPVDLVMHFGAKALVGESMEKPLYYYKENVGGAVALLSAMKKAGVNKVIFSSTCATFGVPEKMPITEQTPQNPVNPYGASKLMVEKMLKDSGLNYGILRYFNAAGADSEGELGEDHDPETHLIPNVLKAALGLQKLTVNGSDYTTPDGSCVRDYIHVEDLAQAHMKLMDKMFVTGQNLELNLGTGVGNSVLEIINIAKKLTERPIDYIKGPRRPGDPPVLVADSSKAKKELNWEPRFKIEDIVSTAYQWMRKNTNGYLSVKK